jgi:hypothetical protein
MQVNDQNPIFERHTLNSLCVQMSAWARCGLLTKTAPATYTIT